MYTDTVIESTEGHIRALAERIFVAIASNSAIDGPFDVVARDAFSAAEAFVLEAKKRAGGAADGQ